MALVSEVPTSIAAAPMTESLGPLLVRRRRLLGLSQGRLATLLCAAADLPTLSRHEVSRWEREERIPTRFWRPWLAAVLGVPADQIEAGAILTRSRRRVATSPPWRMVEVRVEPDADGLLRCTPVRTTRYRP